MALQYMLQATVVQRETRRSAEFLFVPAAALTAAGLGDPQGPALEMLGLEPGVRIRAPDELQDVFFASLSGRVVPFDEGSFDRWRPQRLGRAGSEAAVFAEQLTFDELVPVASSPIRGRSMAQLVAEGTAWTAAAAEGMVHDPLHGLAVLVAAEVGITVTQVAGAVRRPLVAWVERRMRDALHLPPE